MNVVKHTVLTSCFLSHAVVLENEPRFLGLNQVRLFSLIGVTSQSLPIICNFIFVGRGMKKTIEQLPTELQLLIIFHLSEFRSIVILSHTSTRYRHWTQPALAACRSLLRFPSFVHNPLSFGNIQLKQMPSSGVVSSLVTLMRCVQIREVTLVSTERQLDFRYLYTLIRLLRISSLHISYCDMEDEETLVVLALILVEIREFFCHWCNFSTATSSALSDLLMLSKLERIHVKLGVVGGSSTQSLVKGALDACLTVK